jgi:exosortase A-associated hydrolase 2
MAKSIPARPKYIKGAAGDLFIVEYLPPDEIRGTVLVVPPFAEEMNCARRMLSLQATRLASLGFHVVIPDLFGTGDSQGEFPDATWGTWKRDLNSTLVACGAAGRGPAVVIGLRLGGLLALDALCDGVIDASRVVLWNPCVDGKLFISQFLRLRMMAAMIAKGPRTESVADLRLELAGGTAVEIAGYSLTSSLVKSIDAVQLAPLVAKLGLPVHWFEMVADDSKSFPPASARVSAALKEQGAVLETQPVVGPPFWATPEISLAPRLLDATTDVIATVRSGDD